MNETVELILKRMDSHPEEFGFDWDSNTDDAQFSRWATIFYQVKSRMEHMGRLEINDRARNRPLVPQHRSSVLPFLTDEEVELLYDKYVERQGAAFDRYVLAAICGVEPKHNTEEATFGRYAGAGANTLIRTVPVFDDGDER